jgi:hypothetical protein
MTLDVRELEALTGAITAGRALVRDDGRATVSKGALNIKNEWRANAAQTAGAHARLYPRSIGYDLTSSPGGAEAVIGPDKSLRGRQGALGNLLEFGSVRNGPHNDGGRALDAEELRFVAAVEALADRALGL